MPVSALFIELGGVILGLAILARMAARVGLSPIPLYLLAGLAVGEGGIRPIVTADLFIEVGAEIGVILLLFMLGLEYSVTDLLSTLKTSAPAGILDLVLNFGPGVAAGLLLGWSPVAAIFLGGITYMSSTGVIAKLLSDLGWVGNRESPAVLSILVIEDLLMAAYLPVLAILVRGQTAGQGALALLLALGAVLVFLAAARLFGEHLSRALFHVSDEAVILAILGMTFVVAGVAERLQISAAVGSFLLGTALSGPAADRARELLTPLRDLFAAVFFVFFGLKVDPATITPMLLPAAALAMVTTGSKLITGWWSARWQGAGPRGRLRAGAALVARGEFSIAIAALGVATAVESQLGSLAAGYVIILAIMGPLLAKAAEPTAGWLFRPQKVAEPPGEGMAGLERGAQ